MPFCLPAAAARHAEVALRVVVLGGGLTGLSTAYHLGDRDGVVPVLERDSGPGGVARSLEVEGFTFDYTGHLLHFKDPRVAALLEEVVPGLFTRWDRRASIWKQGVRTEYPFQVNTYGRPAAEVAECVIGFVEALRRNEDRKDGSFKEWVLATFGEGFARHFLFPYNEKFWRRDLSEITADWVAWAIPRPTIEAVVEGALGVVRRGLGYNPSFHYPRRGGIGQLADALAARVPGLRTGVSAVAIETEERVVRLSDGTSVPYDRLVSTLPLPELVRMSDLPPQMKELAGRLRHIGVVNFNVGIARDKAWDDHWTYYPDPELPFYRVGVPTNFSDGVAPAGTTSLYVEVTYRPEDEPREEALWPLVREALRGVGIVRSESEIVVMKPVRIPHAYVVFDEDRKHAVPELVRALGERSIVSIGRYGGWEYSSMEKALTDGMDAASVIRRA